MVTRRPNFSGTLFDGHRAHKKPAQIELTSQHIPLTVPNGYVLHWSYSNLRWTAETIHFKIESNFTTPSGRQLEILVLENPDLFETCNKIVSKEFSSSKNRNQFNWTILDS